MIELVDRSTEPKRLVAIERQKRAKWLIKRDSVIINDSAVRVAETTAQLAGENGALVGRSKLSVCRAFLGA